MKHFVYIIQSETSGRYYIGLTHDPKLRLGRHNEGWTRSTKGRGPWKLMYVEECEDKKMAIKREREIKGKKSKRYIEILIHAGGRPVLI
jgi:putative endonuclease